MDRRTICCLGKPLTLRYCRSLGACTRPLSVRRKGAQCCAMRHISSMIKSFKHKGLKLFSEKVSGIQTKHAKKLRTQARWESNTQAYSLRSYFSVRVIVHYAGVSSHRNRDSNGNR